MKDEVTLNSDTTSSISVKGSALHFYNNRLYVGCFYTDGSTGNIDVTKEVAEAISEYIKARGQPFG